MELPEQDRTQISDLINLHGHLTDAGELDQAAELFTPDVTYNLDDYGLGSLHGRADVREAAISLGAANPVGHHVTNIVITRIDDRSARVRSKGIGIKADGTADSVVYDDIVTRQPAGWKISQRKVAASRTALGRRQADAREVLERLREAAISQSRDDMSRVYAVDAAWEFPFTLPGLPSRIEGRNEIVNWISAGWKSFPLKYERYRTLAIYDTKDPETIIVEQEVLGTSASTGEFTLPNIVVLSVHDGEITRVRDYVNIPVTAAAMGRDEHDLRLPHHPMALTGCPARPRLGRWRRRTSLVGSLASAPSPGAGRAGETGPSGPVRAGGCRPRVKVRT
jgi:ketosteroid isomerase-like protein